MTHYFNKTMSHDHGLFSVTFFGSSAITWHNFRINNIPAISLLSLSSVNCKMAAGFSSMLADVPGTNIVDGGNSGGLLRKGQVVVFHTVFDDGTDAGEALAVILRGVTGVNAYWVRFVEVANEYYAWHIFDRAETPNPTYVKLLRTWDDPGMETSGEEVEYVTSWRVLANEGADLELDDLGWLQNAATVRKSIGFIHQMMTSEQDPPKGSLP